MKTLLQITIVLLLFGCKSKEILQEQTTVVVSEKKKDSITKEVKELKELNTFLKDSVSQLNKIIQKSETTITKATDLNTEITSLCDSLGNLKTINQTLGSVNHQVTIKTFNGKLQIQSKQLKDSEITITTLQETNTNLKYILSQSESKHSVEIKELNSKLSTANKTIKELRNSEKIIYKPSKWTYIFLITTILLTVAVVWFLKDKIISIKKFILFWK